MGDNGIMGDPVPIPSEKLEEKEQKTGKKNRGSLDIYTFVVYF